MSQTAKKGLTNFRKELPKKPKVATGVEPFMVFYSYNVIDKKTKRVLDKGHDLERVMLTQCYNKGDKTLRKDLERLVYDMIDNDHFVKTSNRGQKDRTKQERTYDVVVELHGFKRMHEKIVSIVPRLNLEPSVEAALAKRNNNANNRNYANLWKNDNFFRGRKYRGERYNYYSEHSVAAFAS